VLAGAAPTLKDGGYYLVDILIGHRGDATDLVQSGIPKYIVLGVGFVWLIFGLYLATRLINLSGVRPEDSFINRLVFGFGIFPYFQLSAIYTIIYVPEDIVLEIITMFLAVALVAVLAFASGKLPQRQKAISTVTVEWRHAFYAFVLGMSAMAIPFLIFGHS
jgi:hypothetical protein